MKKTLKALFVFLLVFTISCKKDSDTDVVTTQTIHGQVYNLATDSGLANVTIYLNENGNQLALINSSANGNFSFTNVQVHNSNTYTYSLYIPSKSGIGNGPEIGFDGVDEVVEKNNITQLQKCNVLPHIKTLSLFFPNNVHISANDTISLIVEQKIINKNLPSLNSKLIEINTLLYQPPPSNLIDNLNNYWMGWWYSTLDKTKNGIHTIKTDSFYVGWGATVTDTIPWQ